MVLNISIINSCVSNSRNFYIERVSMYHKFFKFLMIGYYDKNYGGTEYGLDLL